MSGLPAYVRCGECVTGDCYCEELNRPHAGTSDQSRTDSLMESLTNIVIGLVISTIANHFVLPAVLGVSMTAGQNLVIAVIFTVISLVRSYAIRRLFNGKSVWAAIKTVLARRRMGRWLTANQN